MRLEEFVRDFAVALKAADAFQPRAISARSLRAYQPGIGPHSENSAVALVLAELRRAAPGRYRFVTQVPYPRPSRNKCDIGLGEPIDWAVEVKMARPLGDNGKPDDTYLKDLLSPYEQDHSALSDASKLRASGFSCRKAILVYGFDAQGRPLETALSALESLLRVAGATSERSEAVFTDLVHPIHRSGRVSAWEVF